MRTYRVQYLLRGLRPNDGPGYYVIREENGVETKILGPYADPDQATHIAHQLNGRIARVVAQLARNSEIRQQALAGI